VFAYGTRFARATPEFRIHDQSTGTGASGDLIVTGLKTQWDFSIGYRCIVNLQQHNHEVKEVR
jgi:hypothetical protein